MKTPRFGLICLLALLSVLTAKVFAEKGIYGQADFTEAFKYSHAVENETNGIKFKSSVSRHGIAPHSKRDTDKYRDFETCRIAGICIGDDLRKGTMDASVYSGIGSLQYYGYYGWKVMTVESELFLLGDVMRERGWDYEDFRCVQWEYEQSWLDPPFTAWYRAWISTEHGAIIVSDAYAPKSDDTGKGFIPPMPKADYPNPLPLRRLSDYLFVVWQDACSNDETCIKSLQWIIIVFILNQSTQDVAQRALGFPETLKWPDIRWPDWPGTTFPYTADRGVPKDNFDALIGCPFGVGVAYTLGQHDFFGSKNIDEVRVFGADQAYSLCIAYHVA